MARDSNQAGVEAAKKQVRYRLTRDGRYIVDANELLKSEKVQDTLRSVERMFGGKARLKERFLVKP